MRLFETEYMKCSREMKLVTQLFTATITLVLVWLLDGVKDNKAEEVFFSILVTVFIFNIIYFLKINVINHTENLKTLLAVETLYCIC